MNKLLNEIHKYLLKKGTKQEDIEAYDTSSVYLSMEIMEYAHRNQKRENGEEYAFHPMRVLDLYRKLVGIIEGDFFCIDKDLMYEYNIPFDGVQEVCILHDVLEDTPIKMEELEGVFDECHLGDHFRRFIKDALKRVTHDKKMDYLDYIKICAANPISAMVKMCDMQDNMNVLDLISLDNEKILRTHNYLNYIGAINYCWNFIENADKYRKEFKKNQKDMSDVDIKKELEKAINSKTIEIL